MNELQAVSFGNIQSGELLAEANDAIKKVCEDVVIRNRIAKARQVSISIKITPEVDEASGLNQPVIDWEVKHSIPGRAGLQTRGIVQKNQVKVNADSIDAPLQNSLFRRNELEENND